MEKKNKNAIPKKEEYKVKYVFNEESKIDINNVIKDCFIMRLKTEKNHPIIL